MNKRYCVYMMTNKRNTVLYTGVSGNLEKRIHQHKNKEIPGFSSKYNLNKLIFYECFSNPEDAIKNEKMIKGWTRKKKEDLISKSNPNWDDLSLSF